MKKTKMVCTLGPASDSYKGICTLLKNGMNVARLNMSHATIESHQKVLDTVKKARKDLDIPCAIMVDTCGPEIRIGSFENGKIELKKGHLFTFSTTEMLGNEKMVACTYPQLLSVVKPNQKIFANNGLLEFKVVKVEDANIVCRVVVGGTLSNHKSISIPRVRINLPFISERDERNIEFACKNDVELISASFVNSPNDVKEMRECIKKYGGRCEIISKIESVDGIKNLKKIIELSDGIMVARGDMGTELPIEQIPAVQKDMIKKTVFSGKRVIVATEMLESMITKRRPTRAEITDVAQAIYDGTTATMLSGETAGGNFPFEACKTMAKTLVATEKVIDYEGKFLNGLDFKNSIQNAISYSACSAAHAINAKVIVCFTDAGKTANMVSRFRPNAKILAITHDEHTYNNLALSWGVIPTLHERLETTEEMCKTANDLVKKLKLARVGDKIVITSGLPAGVLGNTNSIKISEIE